MEYGKIYEDYYSKYYDELELLAKNHFIENHREGLTYNYADNSLSAYMYKDFCNNISYLNNEALYKLYPLFEKRASIFKIDSNQKILEMKIKPLFDKIDVQQLPKNYDFIKFIEELAFIESRDKISSLLTSQRPLHENIYNLDRFDVFEIRTQGNLSVEDFPIYKELTFQLYPENQNHIIENEEIILPKIKNSDLIIVSEPIMNRNHWNENCFDLFNYLVDNYEKKGKIKFINIFYFLKNDVDKERYAFGFTIDQYKNFILQNFEIKLTKFERAEYEYFEKVIPILNGFEQDFRSII